ncbi:MgtC/SapB family protein [Mycolicibacterium sp. YH-1]|uniref:MgtC/SapB family protein n=1 Tax=Mycolicibacterium sp. YH-1 TaxID=2908837 RepID=UPI001F4BEB79|nr:MgtC/SapB family protein [Mycolicibacterium sp. YH-1]UNB54442.1 MgtC/SapB family protein [Mycolicibacterium sp. YH-1]
MSLLVRIDWINDSTLTELILISIAFVLSAVVGVERHRQVKSAGLRTHTLVGVGSALFTLVSAYGFSTAEGALVTLDPTRIAAQIVSGIGFLGAGVIFVKQNTVSGLTTAASIWLVAAIGMACGAGMPVLASAGTLLYLFGMGTLTRLAHRIPVAGKGRELLVCYTDGCGVLRTVLERATELGFDVSLKGAEREERGKSAPMIVAELRFNRGRTSIDELVEQLAGIRGVNRVTNRGEDEFSF